MCMCICVWICMRMCMCMCMHMHMMHVMHMMPMMPMMPMMHRIHMMYMMHRDDGLFSVLSREAMRGDQQVNPLNLANLSWAFASAGFHGEMSTRRIGLRDPEFFDWIAHKAIETLPSLTPQNCSNLVWSYATMRIGNKDLFESMSEQVRRWLLTEFDPQHLSNVLWSYAKLQVCDRTLFEAAAEEIVRRGIGYLSPSPQNISNTIWAYGSLVVKPPSLLGAIEREVTSSSDYYGRLTEQRPLTKSSRAQLAMTVLSLHRLGLYSCAWHLFDRVAADGLQAGGEAYCNWLLIAGQAQDVRREVQVWEQMARTPMARTSAARPLQRKPLGGPLMSTPPARVRIHAPPDPSVCRLRLDPQARRRPAAALPPPSTWLAWITWVTWVGLNFVLLN